MNILVIGSGGREHAIINSISKSNKCSKIFALPGNGGTELLAENLSGDVNDFELIKKISFKYKISLVFVASGTQAAVLCGSGEARLRKVYLGTSLERPRGHNKKKWI